MLESADYSWYQAERDYIFKILNHASLLENGPIKSLVQILSTSNEARSNIQVEREAGNKAKQQCGYRQFQRDVVNRKITSVSYFGKDPHVHGSSRLWYFDHMVMDVCMGCDFSCFR